MASPLIIIIKLLFNPDVSNKIILQMALKQISAIGVAQVISAALGAGTVAISSVIRIPQIKKILDPKQLEGKIKVANGLSLEGLSLETLSQLIHIVYNRQVNTPFIKYGETVLLGIQNVAIILLIEYYRLRQQLNSVSNKSDQEQIEDSLKQLKKPIGVMIAILIFLTKLAPTSLINLLQILNIPITIISRLPQIKNNYVLKSTSHLSEITVGANLLGSAIRVFTTLKSSKKALKSSDYVLLAGYGCGFVLNLVVVGQIVYYKNWYKGEVEDKSD